MNFDKMMATIKDIELFLKSPGKIAIVGASTKESKAGFFVPKYLRKIGFQTLLINPKVNEIKGIPTYNSLNDVDLHDLKGVIIYRRNPMAEEEAIRAINLNLPFIWLPDKIVSEKAKTLAATRHILYVENDCPLRRGNQLNIN